MRKLDRIILKTRDSVIAKSMLILTALIVTLCMWNISGTLISAQSALSTLAGAALSAVCGAALYFFWYFLFSRAYTAKLEESEREKAEKDESQNPDIRQHSNCSQTSALVQ